MSTQAPAYSAQPPATSSATGGSAPVKPPRNLVICLDGTSNQFSSTNTNVIKLFSVIEADPAKQLVFYDSGVGTYLPGSTSMWGQIKRKAAELADLAIAWNFDEHVQNAYKWLMDYYQSGDRIYIFGFSRGAYTARALAGMIQKVGLLPAGNHSQVPLRVAYAVYKSPVAVSKMGHMDSSDENVVASSYRRIFGISKTVNVHFVGVWDTVSSLGGLALPELPFANGVSMVTFFRQALALDEHRARFTPEYRQLDKEEKKQDKPIEASDLKDYANKATSALHDLLHQHDNGQKGNTAKAMQASEFIRNAQRLTSQGGDMCGSGDNAVMVPRNKEVFFMGCHSDCGGGNDPNDSPSLSNIPFRWMLREAEECGLQINAVGLCLMPAVREVPGIKEMIPPELLECLKRDDEDEHQDEEHVRAIVDAALPPKVLHEMIKKAAAFDTATNNDDPAGNPITPDLKMVPQESLTLPWYPLEFFIIENKTYEHDHETRQLGMHLFAPRVMRPGQAIHRSVQKRLRYDHPVGKPAVQHSYHYAGPRAKLPEVWKTSWEALKAGGPNAPMVWED